MTHDIDVVIAGDPVNGGIWPSEATDYKVILHFEGGTPTTLTQQVSSTTVNSQTATFLAVPLGGQVTASVQVYSDTGYQVAQASLGPFANDEPTSGGPLELNLQLTQNLVPLTTSTVYSHKEVIAPDADGESCPGCHHDAARAGRLGLYAGLGPDRSADRHYREYDRRRRRAELRVRQRRRGKLQQRRRRATTPVRRPLGRRKSRIGILLLDGTVLVLESNNRRIQSFDLNANPSQRFGIAKADYYFPLREQPVSRYLGFAVELEGYMYVLSVDRSTGTPV